VQIPIRHRRAAVAILASLGLLATACSGSGSGTDQADAAKAEAAMPSWLFSQTADSGHFEVEGGQIETLVLQNVDPHTIMFSDRPDRLVELIDTAEISGQWGEMFADSLPNAVLVEHEPDGATDSLVVVLDAPAYDPTTRVLTYAVEILADEAHPERISDFVGELHDEAPLEFEAVSLFIDSWKSFKKGASKTVSGGTKTVTKGVNDTGKDVAKGVNDVVKVTESAGQKAVKGVSAEYRNAQGQVVDGLGAIVSLLPDVWPSDLGLDTIKPVLRPLNNELNSVVPALQRDLAKQVASFDGMTAAQAQSRVNDLLGGGKVGLAAIPIPGFAKQALAPYAAPIQVNIKSGQWAESRAMNLQIRLNFMGVKTYTITFGCLGFPNGIENTPKFVLNGGCNNPWKLLANADMILSSARTLAGTVGTEVQKLTGELTDAMRRAGGSADNPRTIPGDVLAIPINEVLGAASTGGNPSVEGAAKSIPVEFPIPGVGTLSMNLGNLEPGLWPELALQVDFAGWTNGGSIDLFADLSYFGISLASVGMGCMTFDTSWGQAPTFTFEGGCDGVWNLAGPQQPYLS
jgi:hypothetical protein